jgi:hypothetical protein
MSTLIIPCAGKSTRFPNMKPKWLLTHPDGSLMLEKSIKSFDPDGFSQIIFSIVKEHDEKYSAAKMLKQAFPGDKYKINLIDTFTQGPAETIYKTIKACKVFGEFFVKDSDNRITVNEKLKQGNFVIGLKLTDKVNINRITSKSFIILNEQENVVDIIEKKIKSDVICLGGYGFKDTNDFINAYEEISSQAALSGNELFISHVISYLIGTKRELFTFQEAGEFEDWGTLEDWKIVQNKFSTYFLDIDGIVLENHGKYGEKNWSNTFTPLEANIARIKAVYEGGAQIIFTTSRPEEYRQQLTDFFYSRGIFFHSLVMGLNHAKRIIVNDFAPTNPYPSCDSISLPRNSNITDYL